MQQKKTQDQDSVLGTAQEDVLQLTADVERVAALHRKLVEYRQRYEGKAPAEHLRGFFKLNLLARFLRDGTLDLRALREQWVEEPWFSHYWFRNVAGVIAAYNTGTEAFLTGGGTGLK